MPAMASINFIAAHHLLRMIQHEIETKNREEK